MNLNDPDFTPTERTSLRETARLLPSTAVDFDPAGDSVRVAVTDGGGEVVEVAFDRSLIAVLSPWQLGTLIIRRSVDPAAVHHPPIGA